MWQAFIGVRHWAGLWAFCAALLFFAATSAHADQLRPMALDLVETENGNWSLAWKQPLGPDSALDLIAPQFPPYCQYSGAPQVRRTPSALIARAQLHCNEPLAGATIALPGLTGTADALMRLQPLGEPVQSLRFTAREPEARVLAEAGPGQVFTSYFVIGTEHILMGWDHLLFVIALVLLVVRGWPVIKAATAFTIAHSITLAASVLGFAGLAQRPVEALIALSILFLAVELAQGFAAPDHETWTRRWPWLVAFAFGLLHGFGFAGALREIGLPQGEVPTALLAFNLGVEAGQIAVIAGVIAVRALIARAIPRAETPALKLATYAIGGIASFWLIERVIAV